MRLVGHQTRLERNIGYRTSFLTSMVPVITIPSFSASLLYVAYGREGTRDAYNSGGRSNSCHVVPCRPEQEWKVPQSRLEEAVLTDSCSHGTSIQ